MSVRVGLRIDEPVHLFVDDQRSPTVHGTIAELSSESLMLELDPGSGVAGQPVSSARVRPRHVGDSLLAITAGPVIVQGTPLSEGAEALDFIGELFPEVDGVLKDDEDAS